MHLKAVTLKNFRCYADEIKVDFADLTTFVGRNDIGKSSVLEALEIFFNNGVVSIEQGDANVHSGIDKVEITCESGKSVNSQVISTPELKHPSLMSSY